MILKAKEKVKIFLDGRSLIIFYTLVVNLDFLIFGIRVLMCASPIFPLFDSFPKENDKFSIFLNILNLHCSGFLFSLPTKFFELAPPLNTKIQNFQRPGSIMQDFTVKTPQKSNKILKM